MNEHEVEGTVEVGGQFKEAETRDSAFDRWT